MHKQVGPYKSNPCIRLAEWVQQPGPWLGLCLPSKLLKELCFHLQPNMLIHLRTALSLYKLVNSILVFIHSSLAVLVSTGQYYKPISSKLVHPFKTYKLRTRTWEVLPSDRRKWQPTPVLLPGKSHGQRSLVGYSPWGRKESDTTERLYFHHLTQQYSRPCTHPRTVPLHGIPNCPSNSICSSVFRRKTHTLFNPSLKYRFIKEKRRVKKYS